MCVPYSIMRWPVTVLISLALYCSVGIAGACQICIAYPQTSAVDVLMEADCVVLAREDPERPFHYRSVEVLKGDLGPEEIDLFLNSATRRLLGIYPKRAVVLARPGGGDQSGWSSCGIADPVFGPLVREILRRAPGWEHEPRQRAVFFSQFLGHENAQLSTLALLEVARAPYREIRGLGGALSRDQLRAFLANYRYVEWHALYILLLAQSEDARDREFIAESFHSAVRFGSTVQLAAWATAFIELHGAEAIDLIEAEYFHNPSRSAKELVEIAKALSVHGTNGSAALRDRIVVAYGLLLAMNPGMTAQIADDLLAWGRREYAAEIGQFVAANPLSFDLSTTLRLRAYARRAAAE